MESKRILIIGGCGYIGAKIFEELKLIKDIFVTTVDLEWFGNDSNPDNIQEDYNKLPKFFFEQFDTIILLAAHSSVQMCQDNMLSSFNNNVRNFINLLSKLESKKFIYASSSSVYGNIDKKNADEECNTYCPNNYYDLGKSEIDNYAKLSGLEYYGLRFGTVNGFSKNLRTDIMINAMVYSAIENKKIIVSNPGISRPILFINDLFFAILEILFSEENHSGFYNLASFNATVDQIAGDVGAEMEVPIEHIESQPFSINKGKLQSKAYDFSIDSSKFENTYKFNFTGNTKKIVSNLMENWSLSRKTKRNNQIHYL